MDVLAQLVAFVDCDDGPEMMLPYWEAEIGGFQAINVPRPLKSIPEIVSFIQDHAQAAICSNRLDHVESSLFSGAELAAALYDAGIPTLLVTRYLDIDQHSSIRRWRSKLPVVLHLREFESSTVKDYLEFCAAELHGSIAESRKPYQVMLHITDVERLGEERYIDVSVGCRDHYQRVRLPASLIPQHLRANLAPDSWLFAHVNIHAKWPEDLYFREFALAPTPEYDEDLVYCIDVFSGVSMHGDLYDWVDHPKDQKHFLGVHLSDLNKDM